MKKLSELTFVFIVIAFLLWCLTACSAEKRLTNLIAKNPNLLKKDSVLISDSILIKGRNATFYFDTTINNYHSSNNGIDINILRSGGQYKLEAKTKDTNYVISHFNYYNNYTTVRNYTFRDKLQIALMGFGVFALLILIVFLLIKFLK